MCTNIENWRKVDRNGTQCLEHCSLELLYRFFRGRQPLATRHSTHVTVWDEYCLKFLALTHALQVSCYYVACGTRLERILTRLIPKASQILGFVASKVPKETANRLCREAIAYAETHLDNPLLWSKTNMLGAGAKPRSNKCRF